MFHCLPQGGSGAPHVENVIEQLSVYYQETICMCGWGNTHIVWCMIESGLMNNILIQAPPPLHHCDSKWTLHVKMAHPPYRLRIPKLRLLLMVQQGLPHTPINRTCRLNFTARAKIQNRGSSLGQRGQNNLQLASCSRRTGLLSSAATLLETLSFCRAILEICGHIKEDREEYDECPVCSGSSLELAM